MTIFRTTTALVLFSGLCWGTGLASPVPGAACRVPAKKAIAYVNLPGSPFQAVATADGCWIFVSLFQPRPLGQTGLAMVRRFRGKLHLKRILPLRPGPAGLTVTHDGKVLIAAVGRSLVFFSVRRLVEGRDDPVLGSLTSGRPQDGVMLRTSASDRRLFVSDGARERVLVVNLDKARRSGFRSIPVTGVIPVGRLPIGLAISPDQKYLYSTSLMAPVSFDWTGVCRPEGKNERRAPMIWPAGALYVVNLAAARTDPEHSTRQIVAAGCSPVRIALSPDGKRAYVTDRGSNLLLVYDTARLVSDPRHALIATVPVARGPIGVAVVDDGREVVVTNSDRFAEPYKKQTLTVIDAARVGAGAGAIVGTVPAGAFPHDLAVTPGGHTLLVTNTNSSSLEVIDLRRMHPHVAGGHAPRRKVTKR